MGGAEQIGYGTWLDGKRNGYFGVSDKGSLYLEEYSLGELRRRMKWREDRTHVKCSRCNMLFEPKFANNAERLCRFHPKPVGEFGHTCCGSLKGDRGCTPCFHVDPRERKDRDAAKAPNAPVDVSPAAVSSISLGSAVASGSAAASSKSLGSEAKQTAEQQPSFY